jgi:hypothetical protein
MVDPVTRSNVTGTAVPSMAGPFWVGAYRSCSVYQDALGYPTDALTLEAARRAAELGAMAEDARARFGGGKVGAAELVSLENLAARAVRRLEELVSRHGGVSLLHFGDQDDEEAASPEKRPHQ